jgi:tetrahydromethanopterin S-methyltransferase subunit B
MKKIFLPILLLVVVFASTAATSGPRVSRATLASMEKSLDERIKRLWDDTPYLLLGDTRGVYLEGYGAVFTAEVNLVMNPVSLMSTRLTKDDIARVRQKKIDRLPTLKKALRESMVSMAASLDTVPGEEQIAIVAFIDHYPWEDVAGIPVQITLTAQKKKLVEAQRAGGTGLEAVIHVTEN